MIFADCRNGEVLGGRYVITSSFGKGVYSTVLYARDSKENDQVVAIKIIRNNETMLTNVGTSHLSGPSRARRKLQFSRKSLD